MSKIKFGTDGWRALMSADFTLENVERVVQAYADHLWAESKKKGSSKVRVVIGYDWRRNSENFARAAAEVLSGNGIEVILSTTACPTPAVSYTIVKEKCDSGLAITASHNPPGYNGVKIKNDFGGSAERAITDAVEALIGKSPVRRKPLGAGSERRDLNEAYIAFLKRYVDIDKIKQGPYHVLVDPMHGVAGRWLETILAGGKLRITTIRGDRDTSFGGGAPEPIPQNLRQATELMRTGKYDLCVVTDGDADRVGAIRPGGEFISPGKILSLIMLHLVEDRKKTGSVVTTISNTGLIYKMARKLGLKVHETPVGFKYVCEIMRRENVLIGGEESGGIGFQDYLYERDGMLSSLLLMEMMAVRGKSIDQILKDVEKEFGKLHYVRNDIDYPNELKPLLFQHLQKNPPASLAGHRIKEVKSSDGMKFVLEDDSWLLFRLSGTEPILRIYSEATSEQLATSLVSSGREIAFGLKA
ncbi:MAG: Phosphoglucosamine mutase [Candidatus Omnitrophica bacterium]|nr:Phosphoglucosamine mutase [Candidatus Omnitrophota bacterium]